MNQPQNPFPHFSLLKVPQYLHAQWDALVSSPQIHSLAEIEVHTLPSGKQEFYLIIPIDQTVPIPGIPPELTELRVPLADHKKPANPCLLFTPNNGKAHIHPDIGHAFQMPIEVIKEAKIPASVHMNLIKHQIAEATRQYEESQLQVLTEYEMQQQREREARVVEIYREANMQRESAAPIPIKALRAEKKDVLAALHKMSQTQLYYTLQEMVTRTGQPQSYIREIAEEYCVKVPEGENKGKYILRTLYHKQ